MDAARVGDGGVRSPSGRVVPIAILGSGAVGALLGGLLAHAGDDIVLVTREGSAEALQRERLRIESPRYGDIEVAVRTVTELTEPVHTLVVAVKAPQLDAALERVPGRPDVVIPLLNGVEHMDALRRRFDGRVVPGSVRVQAHRQGPAHVVHRAPFLDVTLPAPAIAHALTVALRGAGVAVAEAPDEATVLWTKLSRLAGLALATAAADAPLGSVRDDAVAVGVEVAAIARAEGAHVETQAVVAELTALPDAASSSLRADVVAGGEHELDAIAGAVLRAADRHGLAAPRTAALAAAVARRAGTL